MTTTTVVFPFTGWDIGGSHMSAFTLAQALGESGAAECLVVAPEGSPILREAARRALPARSSEETPLPHNKVDVGEIERFARRAARLRRQSVGVIHCNDFRSLLAWSLPARANGTPIVYHHRGLREMSAMKRAVFSSADHVITISDACTDNLRFIPASRRTQIRNPISVPVLEDPAGERAALRDALGVPRDAKVVGFMANFWARKRPALFLEAAATLAAREPDVWFVLFGRDAELTTEELRGTAEGLGLGERVRFAGFKPDPARNFAGVDLLAATAVDEPFGRTLVEAMLCRTPYVATESAGHVEIHRRWRGGLMLSPNADKDAWAEAMRTGLRRGGELTLDSRSLAALQVDVAPPRHAEAVAAIYRELLRRKAGRGESAA